MNKQIEYPEELLIICDKDEDEQKDTVSKLPTHKMLSEAKLIKIKRRAK